MLYATCNKRGREDEHEPEPIRRRLITRNTIHDMTLKSYMQHDDSFTDLTISKLLDHARHLVLFCYRNDFTQQAIQDLNNIHNYAAEFLALQAVPLALSTDTTMTHRAFARLLPQPLGFPLLSDNVRLFCNHLGILDKENGCSKRAIFIINPDNEIVFSQLYDDTTPFQIDTLIPHIS
ncbi:thioredoxin-like protein [Lichtheimia hyalospora FSU 10163]|nr:thioredoxin-like protein [Lichtheimia hyalospora FSU 10163]